MADAVGLSLYVNGGYPDAGHQSIVAMVRMLGLARDLGKDVFVLESGCEHPNVVVDDDEFTFLARVAAPLAPRVWIYEFLKDKFNEQYRSNPGKLVRADGRLRPAAARGVARLFAEVRAERASSEAPVLRVYVDPSAARADHGTAMAANALYELAALVPIRWLASDPGRTPPDGDGQILRLLQPSSDDPLAMRLRLAPEPGSDQRDPWLRELAILILARRGR